MHELSDFELMALVQQGRQEAFVALIQRHQNALLNFFGHLGAHSDAEDLVQETFLRLFRYRARYVPSAKFTTFLYTLARHTWADRWRKVQRKERLEERLQQEWSGVDEGGMEPVRARLDAQAALERLPEKLRLVLVMSWYEGLMYGEIARILRIPVGTVKSRMFLALQQLREMFHEKKN